MPRAEYASASSFEGGHYKVDPADGKLGAGKMGADSVPPVLTATTRQAAPPAQTAGRCCLLLYTSICAGAALSRSTCAYKAAGGAPQASQLYKYPVQPQGGAASTPSHPNRTQTTQHPFSPSHCHPAAQSRLPPPRRTAGRPPAAGCAAPAPWAGCAAGAAR